MNMFQISDVVYNKKPETRLVIP